MDLIRSSIRSLIYSLPIELLAEEIVNDNPLDSLLPGAVSEISKWEQTEFTQSDHDLLSEVQTGKWSVMENYNLPRCLPFAQRFPVLLNQFSDKVLIYRGADDPKVIFTNLLRWREVSLLVGEDTLILPFLAEKEIRKATERESFLWPNVLEHDNFRINEILDQGLSDTHSHINAASDIFEFSWLRLMNETLKAPIKEFRSDSPKNQKREYNPIERYNRFKLHLVEWGYVAAAIRLYFFHYLFEDDFIASEKFTRNDVVQLFSDGLFDFTKFREFDGNIIHQVNYNSLQAENGIILDYAIKTHDFYSHIPTSPYLIHHGERKLLYQWFLRYFRGDKKLRADSHLMLLYLIIKCKIRREFVQTNQLWGFANFTDYDYKKTRYEGGIGRNRKAYNAYWELQYRYAVQTSIGFSDRFMLEARMTPGTLKDFLRMDYRKSIFSKTPFLKEQLGKRVSFIVHLIKKSDSNGLYRNENVRKQLNRDVRYLKDIIRGIDPMRMPNVLGIDAAGYEINCRPEVMAPYFRDMEEFGVRNMTFHAGEDFFDILDGLRTIEEAVSFIGFKAGARIGHGLALGVNSQKFYSERHYQVIAPRQILLDNLVWFKVMARRYNIVLCPRTQDLIDREFSRLYCLLGYNAASHRKDLYEYFQSMRLRGDMYFPQYSENMKELENHMFLYYNTMYSPVSPFRSSERVTKEMLNLRDWYEGLLGKEQYTGEEVEILEVHNDFAKEVAQLQICLLSELEKKGIVIETNPSSNVKIGRFRRYDEHPIFKFHRINETEPGLSMVVSINTDDKGIFGTSLKNEYSLIAAALFKQKDENGNKKWTQLQIENYLSRIGYYGNISRFK